ncbi:hypothetical protein RAZWK3B_09666 [Roseobacter sp. AzwK-3b]|uniref:hypothetical protein n=1 Tax=Roseobacter sp. AzwK-3b TaxID=351016 RepID=UPI0001568D23|nr:hypothetical protein [Roseobacter sp. AzwK-3b]EDM72509.1 hypothetical protein RAZWK3B_09666 [Roseobacter sp. AzwK-3b]
MTRFMIDLNLSDNEISERFMSYLVKKNLSQKSREYFEEQFEKTIVPRFSSMRVLYNNGSNIELSKYLEFEGDRLLITLNTEPLTFLGRLKKLFGG